MDDPHHHLQRAPEEDRGDLKRIAFSVFIVILLFLTTFFTLMFWQENQRKEELQHLTELYDTGNIFYVGVGTSSYSSIQDAVNAAHDFDTVIVGQGTYTEQVVIDKKIRLIGEDKNTTIIDGQGIGITVKIIADEVNLGGFTVRGGGTNWSEFDGDTIFDSGVYVLSDYNTVHDLIVEGNQNTGLALKRSSHNVFSDNITRKNRYDGIVFLNDCMNNTITNSLILENQKSGIFLMDQCDSNVISNNSVKDNKYGGVSFSSCSNNQVLDNEISGNALTIEYYWGGISLIVRSDDNIVSRNVVTNNKFGLGLQDMASNNIISSNEVSHNSLYGMYIYSSSPEGVVNNSFYNNNFDNSVQLNCALYHQGKCVNFWDDGMRGNYWSNYTGVDRDGDGVGETSYTVFGVDNVDRFPLVDRVEVE